MSAAAHKLIDAIDSLPPADRDSVVAELLRRHPVGAGPVPDEGYAQIADDLFQSYDAAEATDATPPG
jgi:hypothetical protein